MCGIGYDRMARDTHRVVPAVDKAGRLLAQLRSGEAAGISELARRIGASKGTVRDILLTLAAHGLVRREADGRFSIDAPDDLRSRARPLLDRLVADVGETAFLGLVDGDAIVIAAVSEPPTDLHVSSPVGRRVPIGAGAHAKVLLDGAAIGYDDEEYLAGVRAVAAPVVDAAGRPMAVVIVVGFKQRVDLAALRRAGARCAEVAAALSAGLRPSARTGSVLEPV